MSSKPAPDEPTAQREPPREGYRSGFLVIVLDDDARFRAVEDLREYATANEFGELREFLGDPERVPVTPVIGRERLDRLARLEERARRNNPDRDEQSLAFFWRVDVSGFDGDPDELARRVAGFPGVRTAYAEQAVAEPPGSSAGPASAVVMMSQSYLEKAPQGIDALDAWTRPGGRGEGVRLVDVEQGWRESHPALAGFTVVPEPPRANRDGQGAHVGAHGTSVVAVAAASASNLPVLGIAPQAAAVLGCSHWDSVTRKGYNVAAAIEQAVDALVQRAVDAGEDGGGDVILLEVQRHGVDGRELPTETDLADFTALRLAADNDMIVIEPAGNGNQDVGLWSDPATGRTMAHGSAATDSGAVMVGAAVAAVTGGGHRRWTTAVSGSNHGARVDCHAWGEAVATASATASGPTYVTGFGGTSAAGAIVAGAAVLAQSMHLATRGTRLGAAALRALLTATGTPQRPAGAPDRIGVMPDLARAGAEIRRM